MPEDVTNQLIHWSDAIWRHATDWWRSSAPSFTESLKGSSPANGRTTHCVPTTLVELGMAARLISSFDARNKLSDDEVKERERISNELLRRETDLKKHWDR